ncbi:g3665 [Coccomyxa viridis]|uniref:G3665 protein n=1 Tax=Coccomyxa viridis TaxID=1274662 RepID=A0ABP1FND3_9CHLO
MAFSLGRPAAKAAPITAVFGGGDASDDEEQQDHSNKRQRLDSSAAAGPAAPSDPEVRKVIDKLADFVAKNGRSFEDVTRQRNPDNGPFRHVPQPPRFLHHKDSSEYRYYEAQLHQAETGRKGAAGPIPAAAPYPAPRSSRAEQLAPPAAPPAAVAEALERIKRAEAGAGMASPVVSASEAKKALEQGDSLAAMEAFTRMAAEKDKARPQEEAERREGLLNETSFDRRRQLAVYRKDGKKGHHMQDFIPPEEMARLLAQSGSETAKAQAAALEEQQRIQADNVGHRMLQAMGWKEGQGLGAGGKGMAAPVTAAGSTKAPYEKGGLGAAARTDVQAGDDDFEAYRKRMMLGYKHRPNPLGNPRKQYDT